MALVGPTDTDDEDAYVSKTTVVALLAEALANLRTAALETRRTNEILKAAFNVRDS